MRIGITGHQKRPGIDWNWVRKCIDTELRKLSVPIKGYSSLAEGSDQVFAEAIIERGGMLEAVIPTPRYERCFSPEGLAEYQRLRSLSQARELPARETDQISFLNAGRYIVDHSNVMIAVWDGKPAVGLGGTADVVGYALTRGTPVIHIDPINRTVRTLSNEDLRWTTE
jgi:hypothetical protein